MRLLRVGLLAATILLGQDETATFDNITVTATRADSNSTSLALSINSKSAAEIKLDQVQTQKELFNSIAGVLTVQTGSVLGHMMSIRTPISTGAYFLYLQDSIPVQSSGFFNHNALAYTNFLSAGSVEVLKGAGTALYGSDAIAATINVQTQKASKESGGSIEARGGSFGYAHVDAKQSGMTNDSSYLISGGYTRSDGWREHTSYYRAEVTARHDLKLNSNNMLKTIFTANQTDAQQAGDLIGLTALQTDPSSIGDLDLNKSDAHRKFDFARLSTEWTNYSFDDLEIDTIAYLRYNRNRYTATWTKWFPENDTQLYTVGVLNKNTIEKEWGRVIVGVDGEYTKAKQLNIQTYDYNATFTSGNIYDYDVNYLALAPYVHTDLPLGERVKLTGGLRFDYNRFEYLNNTATGEYQTSGQVRVGNRTDAFTHLSPKLSLSFAPSEKSLLYARYANGFQIPQASRLYQLTTSNISFTLNPETSNTYEIGYKQQFAAASVESSLYLMTLDDTITSYKNLAGDTYYANGGTTLHYGAELSVLAALGKEWSTKLGYAYGKHQFENDTKFFNNEIASAPNHIANIKLFYRPQYLAGLTLLAEAQGISSYFMDNDNTRSYKGYIFGNIKAAYQFSKVFSAALKVNNITDAIYAETASYAYGKEKYTPASPREVIASFSYSW